MLGLVAFGDFTCVACTRALSGHHVLVRSVHRWEGSPGRARPALVAGDAVEVESAFCDACWRQRPCLSCLQSRQRCTRYRLRVHSPSRCCARCTH